MSRQQAIEMILTRQLASYLALPIFVVDPEGILVFYNEPAEPILSRRFDETGAMPMSEWSTIFKARRRSRGALGAHSAASGHGTRGVAAGTPRLLDPWPG